MWTSQDTSASGTVRGLKFRHCGARPFIDVGFESNNEDGTASCLGWNAFTVNGTSVAAEALTELGRAPCRGRAELSKGKVAVTNKATCSTPNGPRGEGRNAR